MQPMEASFDGLTIPTYIINLKERTDRLSHILGQFNGRNEFEVNIIEAVKHPIGAVGLWKSILTIIRMAMEKDEDVIIICEDDHAFTEEYAKLCLFKNIIGAYEDGANVLLGGIGGFQNTVPVKENRWWIDSFWCTQFLVVYKEFFQSILDEPFEDTDTADGKFSEMTSSKMVIYPFLSVQQDFGYSDVTKSNDQFAGKIVRHFEETNRRFERIKNARQYFREKISIHE